MIESDFKVAMRRLAATVTIISTGSTEHRYGMTATAVTSLSMDPPSLLVCVNRNASIHEPIRDEGRFCINLLGLTHQSHCSIFSGKEKGEERFRYGAWLTHDGVPYLADAQANIFCDVDGAMEYGSHTIFIGRVGNCLVRGEAEPLIYVDGHFSDRPVREMQAAC
jgi:flavin reductase